MTDRARRRTALVSSLILVLFAQTFIPIQSHTHWFENTDGRLVEVCTLQGVVTIDAVTGAPITEVLNARSVAIDFSQLMTSAVSGEVTVQRAALALDSAEHPPAVIGCPLNRLTRHVQIRAPPYLT